MKSMDFGDADEYLSWIIKNVDPWTGFAFLRRLHFYMKSFDRDLLMYVHIHRSYDYVKYMQIVKTDREKFARYTAGSFLVSRELKLLDDAADAFNAKFGIKIDVKFGDREYQLKNIQRKDLLFLLKTLDVIPGTVKRRYEGC